MAGTFDGLYHDQWARWVHIKDTVYQVNWIKSALWKATQKTVSSIKFIKFHCLPIWWMAFSGWHLVDGKWHFASSQIISDSSGLRFVELETHLAWDSLSFFVELLSQELCEPEIVTLCLVWNISNVHLVSTLSVRFVQENALMLPKTSFRAFEQVGKFEDATLKLKCC